MTIMKLLLSKMQKPFVVALCLLTLSISFSSCSDDDDSVPNVENTIWRMIDNTSPKKTIKQISFRDGYATYANVNRYTGVIDSFQDVIAHGRYYYDKRAGAFLIIDERTGKPFEGVQPFIYHNGLLKNSFTFVLYR